MATYEWLEQVLHAPITLGNEGNWEISETITVPSGWSLQRLITSGNFVPVNNDGWSPAAGNPAFATMILEYSIYLIRQQGDQRLLTSRQSAAPPNVEGHNGATHIDASVTWCFPWDMCTFDAEVRAKAVGSETGVRFTVRGSASSTGQNISFPKIMQHQGLSVLMLLSKTDD